MAQKWSAAHPLLATVFAISACGGGMQQAEQPASAANRYDIVQHGRQLVIEHDCGGCHGGGPNPAAEGYLAGIRSEDQASKIGKFMTRARNLTPDSATGIGRYSERQIFNALRYGLLPSATPDATITSTTPGQGNFPATPKYLAPPMPWPSWRHMTDPELWAIAAYLKRGMLPVSNKVTESEGPPDFWASAYTADKIGTYPAPAYPTAHEVALPDASAADRQKIMRGRIVVLSHACGDCHGGGNNPAADGFLAGITSPEQVFDIGPFKTRPRNLTPDNATGLGRFSERQIFNSLRYGLRPGETADVEITSNVPGQGNFPANPKYLAVPMPWPGWRHMSDEDLWAVAAYLKRGLKPVNNRVMDSDGPPDFWASEYTVEKIGPYPAPAFPTARERSH